MATTFTVHERNDATVEITASGIDTTAGTDFEFYLKADESDADTDAIATYTQSGGDVTVTAQSVTSVTVDVEFTAADIANPDRYFWRLDMLTGTDRLTLLTGVAVVKGI